MLERYVEAGLDPGAFWGLSLRLYQIHMRGASARIERQQDEAKAMAWLNAGLARATKLPPLAKVLERPGKEGDVEFRLRAVTARLPAITMAEWAARHGG